MKKIPIGIDDFKEIRTENYFYIDKTKLIEDILNDGALVKLLCCPKKFGKTLNMSMLKYFFDIRGAEENRKLFNNLYIENSPLITKQGKYPIIFLDMKGIEGNTFEEFLEQLRQKFSNLFKEYIDIFEPLITKQGKYPIIFLDMKGIEGNTFEEFLEQLRQKFSNLFKEYIDIFDKLDEFSKLTFKKYISRDHDGLYYALYRLIKILKEYYKKNVIVILDNYDEPLIKATEKGFCKEATMFFGTLYGSALKTNSNLQQGILVGTFTAAELQLIPDLNNVCENTVFSSYKYKGYFGLEEDEVKIALESYNLESNLKEVKEWYGGYKLKSKEIYNTYSILKYLENRKVGLYWTKIYENSLIEKLSEKIIKEVNRRLKYLFEAKETYLYLSFFRNLEEMINEVNENEIFLMMLYDGYLTIKEKVGDCFEAKETYLYLSFFRNLEEMINEVNENEIFLMMLYDGYLTIKEKVGDCSYSVKLPNKEIQLFFNLFFHK